jgi:hypothetical protein
MPADKLFGGAATAPKLKIHRTNTAFEAEASSDFNGTIDVTRKPNPDGTEEYSLKATVTSAASPVLDKYSEWIGAMLPAQQANFQSANTRQQLINDQIGLAYSLVNHLGDKFVSVAPILWPHGINSGNGEPPKPPDANTPGSILSMWKSLTPEERTALLETLIGSPSPVTP